MSNRRKANYDPAYHQALTVLLDLDDDRARQIVADIARFRP